MREFVEYAVAAIAAVAAFSVLLEVSKGGAVRRDPAAWLAVFVVVLGGLFYESGLLPAGQLTQLIFFGALLSCLVISTAQSRRSANIGKGAVALSVFLPAAISSTLFVTNALMNPSLPLAQSLGRLLAVAIVTILALIFISSNLTLTDVSRIIILSVLFVISISPFTGETWRPCDVFKCGPFGAIYTGPFPSENAFAIYVCVGLLALVPSWSRLTGTLALTPMSIVLLATESRTSQLAFAFALAAILCMSVLNAAKSRKRLSSLQNSVYLSGGATLFYSALVMLVAVIGFYLIVTAEPGSFSNRGNIWLRGMAALDGSWLTGLGLDRWAFLQTIGLLPPLYPHSQYLLLLFGGGVFAVFLMVLMLVCAISASRTFKSGPPFTVGYTLFLSVLGLTEAYWNPMTFDGHTMLVVPLILILAMGRRIPSPVGREGSMSSRSANLKARASGRGRT